MDVLKVPSQESKEEEWAKCPHCENDRKDDWWVPNTEWNRYVSVKWLDENLCVDCYLFLVRSKIVEEGQGFPKDDSEMREKIARLVGLDSVPEIDPNAIDKLDGLFDNLIDDSIDCVRLVKDARLRGLLPIGRDQDV